MRGARAIAAGHNSRRATTRTFRRTRWSRRNARRPRAGCQRAPRAAGFGAATHRARGSPAGTPSCPAAQKQRAPSARRGWGSGARRTCRWSRCTAQWGGRRTGPRKYRARWEIWSGLEGRAASGWTSFCTFCAGAAPKGEIFPVGRRDPGTTYILLVRTHALVHAPLRCTAQVAPLVVCHPTLGVRRSSRHLLRCLLPTRRAAPCARPAAAAAPRRPPTTRPLLSRPLRPRPAW